MESLLERWADRGFPIVGEIYNSALQHVIRAWHTFGLWDLRDLSAPCLRNGSAPGASGL